MQTRIFLSYSYQDKPLTALCATPYIALLQAAGEIGR